jgi:geranylgeranyl pyrophosphate synthase
MMSHMPHHICRMNNIHTSESLPARLLEGATIPSPAILDQVIDLKFGASVDDWLEKTLLMPVSDILGRPSKRFRAKLVELGCLLTTDYADLTDAEHELCLHFGSLIELLHAGSLVVDDIEDQSQVRRGQLALHLKYGLPMALNAGNWLYFWPLMLVAALRLPPERELWAHRLCHHMMVKLHCGQALDSGVTIDTLSQDKAPGVCLASMELKTGAMTALALSLGAAAAESPAETPLALDEFGHGFGVALQMFDDIGNLQGRKEPEKRYEDLIARRPCWAVAFAAQSFPRKAYCSFIEAIRRLPDDGPLQNWLAEQDFLGKARRDALKYLEKVFQRFESTLEPEQSNKAGVLQQLRLLGQQVSDSYH